MPDEDKSPDALSPQRAEVAEAEKKLQPILEGLPGPKQREIRESFEAVFMAAIERSGPRLDPETAKIITASIDRDNDHKFTYLSQRQADTAAERSRDHDLKVLCHKDGMTLLKPIVLASILLVLVGVSAGIYFIANGQEAVGSSLLTGVFALLFGYLGGLGTSRFIKTE